MSHIITSIELNGRLITTGIAEVSISSVLGSHKIDAEILLLTDNDIKNDSKLILNIGFEGMVRKFNLTTIFTHVASSGKKKIFASSIGHQLDYKFICESYNDDTAVAVIKRLLSKAEFTDILVGIEDISIPHIIFNNIRLTEAIKKVIMSVTKHNGILPYIIATDDKITILDKLAVTEPKERFITGINIINHEILNATRLEIPLTVNLNLSDTIKIEDSKKSVNGLFRIYALEHTVKAGVGRTVVSYI